MELKRYPAQSVRGNEEAQRCNVLVRLEVSSLPIAAMSCTYGVYVLVRLEASSLPIATMSCTYGMYVLVRLEVSTLPTSASRSKQPVHNVTRSLAIQRNKFTVHSTKLFF